MRWLFCNKVEMLMKKNCEKVNPHKGQRNVRENKETKKENGSSIDNLKLFCMASA